MALIGLPQNRHPTWRFACETRNINMHGSRDRYTYKDIDTEIRTVHCAIVVELNTLGLTRCYFCSGFGHKPEDCVTGRKIGELKLGGKYAQIIIKAAIDNTYLRYTLSSGCGRRPRHSNVPVAAKRARKNGSQPPSSIAATSIGHEEVKM